MGAGGFEGVSLPSVINFSTPVSNQRKGRFRV